MVYITSWNDFVAQASALFCQAPDRSRYTWKFRACDQDIVLKITDDRKCLQYRTSQQNELKLIEQWNLVMLRLCTTSNPQAHVILAEIEEAAKAEREAKKKTVRKAK